MNTEYLRINLYEKAYKEQQEFIAELKKSTPEKIIEQAYELVMREDILMTFEDDYLSPEQAKALLKLEYPLAACYRTWLKNDCSSRRGEWKREEGTPRQDKESGRVR